MKLNDPKEIAEARERERVKLERIAFITWWDKIGHMEKATQQTRQASRMDVAWSAWLAAKEGK